MTQYALFFNTETNKPYNMVVYRDAEIPPEDHWPPNTKLFVFDETTENFDMLYGVWVEDQEKVYLDYDAFNVVLDPVTGEFTFPMLAKLSNIELIREIRNKKIAETDVFMYAPDLPDSITQQLLAYRQALRDITNGLDPETAPDVITWPEMPAAFQSARMDV